MTGLAQVVTGVLGNNVEVPTVASTTLEVTDGTTSVTPTNQLTFSGAAVSGTEPNATVTIDNQLPAISDNGTDVTITEPLILTGQTSTPGSATGTLTNAPTSGNPAVWLRISINGTIYYVPGWT